MAAGRQPKRPHHVAEWAERENLTPTEISIATGADKSLISRWFAGTIPSDKYQKKLAELFNCEQESIFLHPDVDWMVKFLRGRPKEQIEQIKATLEMASPRGSS